jgi:hypothetical protein
MKKSNLLQRLTPVVALSAFAACASTQSFQSQPISEVRTPANVTAASMTKKIDFHEAESNDFKIDQLKTKSYSIENREDRLEFKTKLAGLLSRYTDKLPDSAAASLEEAIRLLTVLDTETPDRADMVQLQETIDAYNSNFISPIPRAMWLGALPYEAVKMLHHSIMNERAPEASDLVVSQASDSSKIDPKPSGFWQPGRDVSKIDMYNGFGRTSPPKITSVCTYDGPKKSYGVHGGFKLKCGADGKFKFKFGNETKTEPFNSRLVWALGFNVTRIDYTPEGTRVEYDRNLIAEYNSRKDLQMNVKSMLGFTYFKKNLQVAWNPFEGAISSAVLQDGSIVKAEALRAKLIRSMPQKDGHDDWGRAKEAQFNESYEKKIKYLVLHEASIEGPADKNEVELGSWSWRSLDHPDRREVRAFGILMAWVNAFDMRQNNNKTFAVKKSDGTTVLSHQVSDLGSGFGRATNILHYKNGDFEQLPWDLVRLRSNDDNGDADSNEDGDPQEPTSWVTPYNFPHYSVIEKNPSFSRIQLDDAQWITRKLAQLSEAQIQDTLIAAGFTAAETKLVLEKLLDRRKQLVDVFGLAKEFPRLMDRKINRSISFDPKRDHAPRTSGQTKNAAGLAAPKSNQQLENGHLVD